MAAKKQTAKPRRQKRSTLTGNERAALQLLSAIAVRAGIAARLGKSFGGDRDVYTAMGYPTRLTLNDYLSRYHRQDIARAIVDKPVRACWRKPPAITESDKKETEFEKRWVALTDQIRIFRELFRVDRLARIGTYGVLLLGFDDSKDLSLEVSRAKKLLYLMPYSQANAEIASSETNPTNPRYGLPLTYKITMKTVGSGGNQNKTVHWSRVIHVAEDCLENNVEGTPALRSVWNRLQDLEHVAGAAAEGYWRGAFPGMAFKKEEGHNYEGQAFSDLGDEVENYLHSFQRYLRIQGVDLKELRVQVADPSKHASMLIDLIACAEEIPKRILLGSERGELASSQDEKAWMETVDARRKQHCEPVILRPFIDRLVTVGVLPKPSEGYTADWPDLMAASDKEVAEIGQMRAKALKDYVDGIGANDILPPDMFLEKILGLTRDEVNQVNLILEGMQKAGAK